MAKPHKIPAVKLPPATVPFRPSLTYRVGTWLLDWFRSR